MAHHVRFTIFRATITNSLNEEKYETQEWFRVNIFNAINAQ